MLTKCQALVVELFATLTVESVECNNTNDSVKSIIIYAMRVPNQLLFYFILFFSFLLFLTQKEIDLEIVLKK